MKTLLIYRSTSKKLLNLYISVIKSMSEIFKFHTVFIASPIKKKHTTLLKSPHVNKRSKENFELAVYKFKIYTSLNPTSVKLLCQNVPKNIHLKTIYFL